MSLRSLLSETVTIQTHSEGAVDDYGDPAPQWSAGSAARARLELTDAVEVNDGRTTRISNWRLFLLPDTVIGALDRVVDAEGRTFEVVGEPAVQRSPRGPHHIEARLALVAG